MIELTDRVADIVIERPLAARVFERHEIDYCCRGDRPLSEACADAHADPAGVIAELQAVPASPTAAEEPHVPSDVGGLIGHVVATHHTYLRRELPRLAELAGKVVAAHGVVHPEVHDTARLLSEITDDLLPHLVKEERVLFPLAIALLGAVGDADLHCGSVRNPIGVMHVEHERVGALLAALRASTNGYRPPDDACPTWRALTAGLEDLERDVHVHVHLENNVLFPAIERLEQVGR